MDWHVASAYTGLYHIPVVTKKDLLTYLDLNDTSPLIAVRRRNAEGIYELVASVNSSTPTSMGTNGKWIYYYDQTTTTLFSIDSNNAVSTPSSIPTVAGFLLSNDTFVGFDSVSNGTIKTYQYDSSGNSWQSVPGADLVVPTKPVVYGDIMSYHVSDTHLTVADNSNPQNVSINIFARQADMSWNLTDSFPVNSTDSIPHVVFNGVDTVVYTLPAVTSSNVYGIIFIYTKINGEWTQQKFDGADLQYKYMGYIGVGVAFFDANTLFITAGFDGIDSSSSSYVGGKVLMLKRDESGAWTPTLDFSAANTALTSIYYSYYSYRLFGVGVSVNDYDIIFSSLDVSASPIGLRYYSVPICIAQPLKATCNNIQVSDCSREIDVADLYTLDNRCGVTPSIRGFSVVDNEVRTHISFSRIYGSDVSCNATVTCPAPPVAPIAVQVPVANTLPPTVPPTSAPAVISTGSTPVALTVSAPTATSNAGALQLGFVSLFAFVASVLL